MGHPVWEPEVGIYKRKVLREKEENTLSTKKKLRFKKKERKHANDQLKKQDLDQGFVL